VRESWELSAQNRGTATAEREQRLVDTASQTVVNMSPSLASVLVAVRVTVTDIDGVNKPSQAYRLRVVVHEDDNGRM
jgi:Mce-associated membrane protein